MLAWGIVMTLMGVVQSYGGLLAARFFLGVAEAGFFPGATFLLTLWYKRYEVQGRLAVFYTAASLSGAFSGLLAYGISFMDGISGLGGWRWIFILEGIVPCLMAPLVWFYLPDDPETANFLTRREKEFIINRLALETGSGRGRVTNADKIGMKHIVSAFKEWKIWCAWVMFCKLYMDDYARGLANGVQGPTQLALTVSRRQSPALLKDSDILQLKPSSLLYQYMSSR